jgi:hypothetical protein
METVAAMSGPAAILDVSKDELRAAGAVFESIGELRRRLSETRVG